MAFLYNAIIFIDKDNMADKKITSPSDFHQSTNMTDCLGNADKRCLIEDIKNLLGGGIIKIEITDSAWCSFLNSL